MSALINSKSRSNQGLVDHWQAQISRFESLIPSSSSEEEKQIFEDSIVRLRAEIEQAEEIN